jgi:hypothetical protein
MHQRDTRLLPGLEVSSYSRFILFPLPGGSATYKEYLQKVTAKLPSDSLSTVRVAGHDFVSGPISELPLLFPAAALPPKQGVYTLLHSGIPAVNSRAHSPE